VSEENVEIVRREYAALAARDWEALADLCHPDIEYETLERTPGLGGCLHGLREITEFFDAWAEPYGEFRVEAEEIVDVGDQVVVVERHAARALRGSEAEAWVGQSFACLISLRDGRISRVKEYPTREDALEAAGLGE
jgi:ketosteroid isomerase-like protein